MEFVITWRSVALFLVSGVVLSVLFQLQIFLQFYVIELLGLLTGLGLLELYVALDISNAFERI